MHSPAYLQQLDNKTALIRRLFSGIPMPEWQVFPSPEQHYRMRAEFRIWHEGDGISYAMFERGQKAGTASLIRLADFPAASAAINRLMPLLLAELSTDPLLKNRLYQCEFLSTLSGEMLVSLIYHRKLDDDWKHAALALQEKLGIFIIGRSKGQKLVLAQDFVTETLTVNGETFRYRQTATSPCRSPAASAGSWPPKFPKPRYRRHNGTSRQTARTTSASPDCRQKNLPKRLTAAANSAACRNSKSTWPNTAFPPSSSIRRARAWTTTP